MNYISIYITISCQLLIYESYTYTQYHNKYYTISQNNESKLKCLRIFKYIDKNIEIDLDYVD